jgi:hypothetical protein
MSPHPLTASRPLTPVPAPDHPDEIERGAFNTAFHELGLRWFWDRETWQSLAAEPCEHARVRQHLVQAHSHLLSVYDADALSSAIVERKQRCRGVPAAASTTAWPQVSWSDARWGEVGV